MKQRGVGLVLALTVITLVGAATTLMVLHVGQLARQRQNERARCFAQIVLDSGLGYTRTHREAMVADRATGETVLPADDLVPSPAKAWLTLRLQHDGAVYVRARVELGRARATEEAVVPSVEKSATPLSKPAL